MRKIVVLILLLLLLIGCNQRNIALEDSTNSVVEDENQNEINIKSFTEFNWDKVYLFTPYSTTEQIEEQLKIKFNDKSNIDYRDDIYLLVFLDETEVVQYVEIERQGCDFSVEEMIT